MDKSFINDDEVYAGYFALLLCSVYDISTELAIKIVTLDDNEIQKCVKKILEKAHELFTFSFVYQYNQIVYMKKPYHVMAEQCGISNTGMHKRVMVAKELINSLKTLYCFNYVEKEEIDGLFHKLREDLPNEEEKREKREVIMEILGL